MSEPLVDVGIQIDGLEELARNVGMMDEILGSETERAIERLLILVQGRLAIYPPPVGGSRYRRTGQLGQMWAGAAHRIRRVTQATGHLYVEGKISNARPGIEYVQSLADQAPVHRGRWTTAEKMLEELQPEADRLLGLAGQSAVNAAAER